MRVKSLQLFLCLILLLAMTSAVQQRRLEKPKMLKTLADVKQGSTSSSLSCKTAILRYKSLIGTDYE